MRSDNKKEIDGILASTKDWNGEQGLIVPPALAKQLKDNGFESGYSESRPIPLRGKRHD